MNPFGLIYNEILWRPLFNALVWFYTVLPFEDLGLAIIALTVVIRILLTPLLWRAQASQKNLTRLQPEIKKIQAQHSRDRESQGKALMELYARERLNPFSGCLLLLLQLPILIALFSVFQRGFEPGALSFLYPFIKHPGALNPVSMGILDLSKGNIYLGIIAALTQYFQTKMSSSPPQTSSGEFARVFHWQTLYLFPALVLVWSYTLPSALTLYWTVLNVFGILQELVMRKLYGSGSDKTGDRNPAGAHGVQ